MGRRSLGPSCRVCVCVCSCYTNISCILYHASVRWFLIVLQCTKTRSGQLKLKLITVGRNPSISKKKRRKMAECSEPSAVESSSVGSLTPERVVALPSERNSAVAVPLANIPSGDEWLGESGSPLFEPPSETPSPSMEQKMKRNPPPQPAFSPPVTPPHPVRTSISSPFSSVRAAARRSLERMSLVRWGKGETDPANSRAASVVRTPSAQAAVQAQFAWLRSAEEQAAALLESPRQSGYEGAASPTAPASLVARIEDSFEVQRAAAHVGLDERLKAAALDAADASSVDSLAVLGTIGIVALVAAVAVWFMMMQDAAEAARLAAEREAEERARAAFFAAARLAALTEGGWVGSRALLAAASSALALLGMRALGVVLPPLYGDLIL